MEVQREGFNTAALVLFKGKQASVKVSNTGKRAGCQCDERKV